MVGLSNYRAEGILQMQKGGSGMIRSLQEWHEMIKV